LSCGVIKIEGVLGPESIGASCFQERLLDGPSGFDFVYGTEGDEFSAEEE
jgi:hypothetical protein